jgi:hypothetical protein
VPSVISSLVKDPFPACSEEDGCKDTYDQEKDETDRTGVAELHILECVGIHDIGDEPG